MAWNGEDAGGILYLLHVFSEGWQEKRIPKVLTNPFCFYTHFFSFSFLKGFAGIWGLVCVTLLRHCKAKQ